MQHVLNEILEVWKRYPQLRFMQLLGNMFSRDAYYVTDDELIEVVREYPEATAAAEAALMQRAEELTGSSDSPDTHVDILADFRELSATCDGLLDTMEERSDDDGRLPMLFLKLLSLKEIQDLLEMGGAYVDCAAIREWSEDAQLDAISWAYVQCQKLRGHLDGLASPPFPDCLKGYTLLK